MSTSWANRADDLHLGDPDPDVVLDRRRLQDLMRGLDERLELFAKSVDRACYFGLKGPIWFDLYSQADSLASHLGRARLDMSKEEFQRRTGRLVAASTGRGEGDFLRLFGELTTLAIKRAAGADPRTTVSYTRAILRAEETLANPDRSQIDLPSLLVYRLRCVRRADGLCFHACFDEMRFADGGKACSECSELRPRIHRRLIGVGKGVLDAIARRTADPEWARAMVVSLIDTHGLVCDRAAVSSADISESIAQVNALLPLLEPSKLRESDRIDVAKATRRLIPLAAKAGVRLRVLPGR